MDSIIYLDNSATTKPCEAAIRHINLALNENWGNPSSLHTMGINAEIAVSDARESIASLLNCREDEVFFTSCGTESNNTVFSAIKQKKHIGNRIITTTIEHPSVLEPIKRLEEDGYEVIRLSPNNDGVVSLDELKDALNANTCLVSIMMVNNEIGSVQPVFEAAKLTKRLSPKAIFHTDAVQAFGKMKINLNNSEIDFLTASAHKIHGPKGIGILYKKKSISISPLLLGGGQEKGLRSGTEAVPLICGFYGAIKELNETHLTKIKSLNDYARKKLLETGLITINSSPAALPYILNVSMLGYRSEVVQHFLEAKNIFLSSGSACAKGELSYVLKAIGKNAMEIDSALRISFSRYNTTEDIDLLIDALCEASKKLKKVK